MDRWQKYVKLTNKSKKSQSHSLDRKKERATIVPSMSDHQKPNTPHTNLPNSSKLSPEISNGSTNTKISGQKITYPNPPDPTNPDPATLRDQWRYAIRQYSKWYSHAWGTAILAGISFFALGWVIKGGNPLPSFKPHDSPPPPPAPPHPANEEAKR